MMFRFLVIFTILIFSACSKTGPVIISPEIKDVPRKFSIYSSKPDYSVKWWEGFKNSELNNLIESAMKNNLSIAELMAGLRQIRAEALKKGAESLPTLTMKSENEFEREKEKGSKAANTESLSLGVTLSYEIDLWDRIKSVKNRARLDFKASKEDFNSYLLILSGEVANSWIELISLTRQISFLEEQLDINNRFLKLIEIRFRNASSTTLDLYQQRKVLERIKASLIDLKAEKKMMENHLSVLTGKAPDSTFGILERNFPKIKKVPDVGVPADLISMRPDVRAAGLRLKSSGWAVAAAKADRLPKLSLSASYTYSSDKIKDIYNNWIWNLTANIVGPLFDGGIREAEVERTRYVVEERIASYKKTVITAIREVEDALSREKRSFESLFSVDKRIEIAEKIVEETEYRYLKGVTDLFPVIREKLALLDLLQSKIKVEAELIKARVVLYKSLGGTWMEDVR